VCVCVCVYACVCVNVLKYSGTRVVVVVVLFFLFFLLFKCKIVASTNQPLSLVEESVWLNKLHAVFVGF